MPVQLGRSRFYAGGELPIGDAFIAWARTAPAGADGGWKPVRPGWFLPFHALSAALGGALVWWGVRILRPRASPPRRTARIAGA